MAEVVPVAPPAWEHLPKRARTLFYLQALLNLLLFWVPVTAGGTLALAWWWSPLWAGVIGAVWFLSRVVLALWMPSLEYERLAWALRDEDLLIAEGVFFRSVTAIPAGRIQHVDTRQGPVERWLGLSRVQIYTASGSGADGVIPGLDQHVAEELRDRLVREHGDDGV